MSNIGVFKQSKMYLADSGLVEAFMIARMLGKPLILEGEPGTGKTKLAQEYAAHEKLPIFEFPVTSDSKIEHLISKYDATLRLMDTQAVILNAQAKQAGLSDRIDIQGRNVNSIDDYLRLGPLALAYQTPNSVLLIDEIDKAPREFPNNLLYVLSERKIRIPETDKVIEISKKDMPAIIITSNREQALPAPFLRRCVYYFIEFPDKDRMEQIVRLHHPDVSKGMMMAALNIFYMIRELGLEKNPATGELLDWIEYAARAKIKPDDLSKGEGWATLIKNDTDMRVLPHIKKEGIENVHKKTMEIKEKMTR